MIVFVCTPYRGSTPLITEGNVERTITICRALAYSGHIPIAPHLYFTRFLDDGSPPERALGIEWGHKAMDICEIILVEPGPLGKPSEGMGQDIDRAERTGKRTVDLAAAIGGGPEAWPTSGMFNAGGFEVLRKAGLVKIGGS